MLSPGELVDGKYRVVRRLGEGGMGTVFEGINLRLNRRVAIKVLHAEMAKQRTLVTRFEREAQAAANIGSLHVVEVFDMGDLSNGDRYMVMEFLDGESLQARLAAHARLTPQVIAKIAVQLLEGLAKVHQAGIIHRDLKPANIFLTRGDQGAELVKILDFGVCKMTDKGAKGDVSTGVGAILGTLAYMSPEQVEHGSKSLDGRADLYAVGVILYRAVTGTLPYGAKTIVDLMRQLREGHAPRVEALASDVDKQFAAIVSKTLEWDRTARYGTAKELQRALLDWLEGQARIKEVLSDFLETAPSSSTRSASDTEPPPSSSSAVGRVALVAKERPREPTTGRPPPKYPAAIEEELVASASGERERASVPRSSRRTVKMHDAPPNPEHGEIEVKVELDDE